ncbi:MAG: hypothetical protein AABZ33_12790 [Chloroflexota bacterium]
MTLLLAIAIEATPKKTFGSAIDWPGLARSAKTEELALDALLAALPRYARALDRAGHALAGSSRSFRLPEVILQVAENETGSSGTEFGVPSRITTADHRTLGAAEATRRAAIVAAAWAEFDAVVAVAPAELRKGPRGGGRDRDRIVAHVTESDHAYAREMGIRVRAPAPDDPGAIAAMREAVLTVLRAPSDGSPLAGRRWTARYAAHRIAWHALDHAWEIEDRTEPPSDED